MYTKNDVVIDYNRANKEINVNMKNCENLAVLTKEAIEGYIREGVSYMFNYPDEAYWYERCGDTLVLITREDDKTLNIVVSTPRSNGYAKEA